MGKKPGLNTFQRPWEKSLGSLVASEPFRTQGKKSTRRRRVGETRCLARSLLADRRRGDDSNMVLCPASSLMCQNPSTGQRLSAKRLWGSSKCPHSNYMVLIAPSKGYKSWSERAPQLQHSCSEFRNQVGSETTEPSVSEKIKKWGNWEEEVLKQTLIWVLTVVEQDHDEMDDKS